MTETEKLQEYIDQIYGKGFYRIEYHPFKGFDAVCTSPNAQPHVQHLGPTAAHAYAHLDAMAELKAHS